MRFAAILTVLLATPTLAEVPRVVTDFAPVRSLVSEVMGDLGEPVALLPAGADPHDFQLRPSQANLLAEADLIFWTGPDLIPALGNVLAALAPEGKSVALLTEGGGTTRSFADGGTDPHGWLDPLNAMAWLTTIAQDLSVRDPQNAATYSANAAQSIATLRALDGDLIARLAPVRNRPFVVYHDALGYFTDHYGLAVAGAIELGDAASPSAAHLARIQYILAANPGICVFPEVGRDARFIAALSEGLAVKVGAALDIEFIDLPAGPGQYAAVLRNLTLGLVDCLKRDEFQ